MTIELSSSDIFTAKNVYMLESGTVWLWRKSPVF